MPGRVVRLLVAENSEVEAGQGIVVVEAMKMQNEIIAQVSGKIRKISVKAGDSVTKDDVLMEIER
jgi:pyruvate carboxylase subunit B